MLKLLLSIAIAMIAAVVHADEDRGLWRAQQRWIHENHAECCDHRDCQPARVTWSANGWRVLGIDGLVPPGKIKSWPFPQPFACVYDGKVRCLLIDAGG